MEVSAPHATGHIVIATNQVLVAFGIGGLMKVDELSRSLSVLQCLEIYKRKPTNATRSVQNSHRPEASGILSNAFSKSLTVDDVADEDPPQPSRSSHGAAACPDQLHALHPVAFQPCP